MKQFIIRFIIFIAPVLIVCVTAEFLLRNIPNDYRYKKEYLDKHANEIELLVLGNSHFYYGIDPKYFHFNSFNAAYPSQPLNYDMAIIDKYSGKWERLKYIVLPVDYFSFYLTLESSVESWRVKDYFIYYKINLSSHVIYPSELLNTQVNIISNRLNGYYVQKKSVITCSVLGWGINYTYATRQDLELSGDITARRHTGANDSFFNKNLVHLKAILSFAKERKVKVYVVTCPTYKTYSANLDTKQLSKTINTIKTISSSYPNVTYLNLLTSNDFVADDFYDADHLNEFGAKKLTQKIDSIIRSDEQSVGR